MAAFSVWSDAFDLMFRPAMIAQQEGLPAFFQAQAFVRHVHQTGFDGQGSPQLHRYAQHPHQGL
jgi:hypothetical protein